MPSKTFLRNGAFGPMSVGWVGVDWDKGWKQDLDGHSGQWDLHIYRLGYECEFEEFKGNLIWRGSK